MKSPLEIIAKTSTKTSKSRAGIFDFCKTTPFMFKLTIAILSTLILADCLMAQSVTLDTTRLRVTYPRYGQNITTIDSTFIFGSAPPGWSVDINGAKAITHPEGGWIAFLPVHSGEFTFNITARPPKSAKGEKSLSLPWIVKAPEIPEPDKLDSIRIYSDHRLPDTPRTYFRGDIIEIQFRGTIACNAWAKIPGIADSIPMSESDGIPSPFGGNSVFDSTTGRAHPRILGIYQGMYRLTSDIPKDSVRVIYNLRGPTRTQLFDYFENRSVRAVDFDALELFLMANGGPSAKVVTDSSNPYVFLNSISFPRTVEFTDTVQVMRVGPRRGYLGLFQPAGVRALATGYDGDWYTIKLGGDRTGYVFKESVKLLDPGVHPPHSRISSFQSAYTDTSLTITASLSGKHPYSITEPDRNTLVLELYGVMMDTDWFRHDFKDPNLENVTWEQPNPDIYRLTLRFNQSIWGYRADYQRRVFRLRVNYPPKELHTLRGKRIVVDPGHSRDPGSIGPTGYTEANANLAISLILAEDLKRRGAVVTLTRNDTSHVELYDRPKIADSAYADLFVSVHNNALPDGVNPFENYGVSTYYYHTHSIDLARSIHQEMLTLPNQRDHGLYHGNLAVIRPTERPSVLVECGFMILPEQEAWLKTDEYRRRVAHAIADGIENFFSDFGRGEN